MENRKEITQGQKDTKLSEDGMEQARLTGIRLQDEHFTHVYSSDLHRSSKTCEIIMEQNRRSSCSITFDPRFRGRKFGIYEGRPRTEFHMAAKLANKSIPEFKPPGGETNKEVHERAVVFFNELYDKMRALSEQNTMDSSGNIKNVTQHTASSSSPDVSSSHDRDEHEPGRASADGETKGQEDSDSSSEGAHAYRDMNCSSCSSVEDKGLPEMKSLPMEGSDTTSNVIPADSSTQASSSETPALLAEILLVTHGTMLRELLRHFHTNFGCNIPGVDSPVQPPNTGISKFRITLSKNAKQLPHATCIMIHGEDHLTDKEYTEHN